MDTTHASWKHQFASDNVAAICPAVWKAMDEANHAPNSHYAIAYGQDDISRRAADQIRALFETDCDVYFVYGGTASNALALSTICDSYHGLIAHRCAHVSLDEANAPEFFTGGAKIIGVDGREGKLDIDAVLNILALGHRIHAAKVRGITITQATEAGTCYGVEEILRITSLKKRYPDLDLKVHMDGARFANAMAASPDVTPKAMTWQAGVDVLTFGATKNGAPASEAIIFFDRELATDFEWRRKQMGQLASKMRYLSSPWLGLLDQDAWLDNARHANRQAARLSNGLTALRGVELVFPTEANMAFLRMPPSLAEGLSQRGWQIFFYQWFNAYRFMCSWSTTDKAVDALLADAGDLAGA